MRYIETHDGTFINVKNISKIFIRKDEFNNYKHYWIVIILENAEMSVMRLPNGVIHENYKYEFTDKMRTLMLHKFMSCVIYNEDASFLNFEFLENKVGIDRYYDIIELEKNDLLTKKE